MRLNVFGDIVSLFQVHFFVLYIFGPHWIDFQETS